VPEVTDVAVTAGFPPPTTAYAPVCVALLPSPSEVPGVSYNLKLVLVRFAAPVVVDTAQ